MVSKPWKKANTTLCTLPASRMHSHYCKLDDYQSPDAESDLQDVESDLVLSVDAQIMIICHAGISHEVYACSW